MHTYANPLQAIRQSLHGFLGMCLERDGLGSALDGRRREHDARARVQDAPAQRLRREARKHHRVHRANARARQLRARTRSLSCRSSSLTERHGVCFGNTAVLHADGTMSVRVHASCGQEHAFISCL